MTFRDKLVSFPCYNDDIPGRHCRDNCLGCELGEVYREYLLLRRCTTVLLILEKKSLLDWVTARLWLDYNDKGIDPKSWRRWKRLRAITRSALIRAGLVTGRELKL